MMKLHKTKLITTTAFFTTLSLWGVVNTVDESFMGTVLSDSSKWERQGTNAPYLTAPSLDPDTEGWLRLTDNIGNQANYIRYKGEAIESKDLTIYASFDFTIWNKTASQSVAADGITFFINDANRVFQVGANGGSLGYAQKSATDGMHGGYLGIGIDEYGNFANATEGRVGGASAGPLVPNTISVRGGELLNTNGTQNRNTSFPYLSGTADAGSTPLDIVTNRIDFPTALTRPTFPSAYRRCTIVVTPTNQLTVYLQFGTEKLQPYFSADLSNQVRPDQILFGFTSGTGGSTANHEIRNVLITTFEALEWGNGTGTMLWDTDNNWLVKSTPEKYKQTFGYILDVKFSTGLNGSLTTNQTVNLQGITRKVHGITVDAPFTYTFQNGAFDFNEDVPGYSLSVTSVKGGNPSAVFDVPISTTADLTLNVDTNSSLTLKQPLNNGGNYIYCTNVGSLTFLERVYGSGSFKKTGSGTIYMGSSTTSTPSNTFSGQAIIERNSVVMNINDTVANNPATQSALGTSGVTLSSSATLSWQRNDQLNDKMNMQLSGGRLYLNQNRESRK
jgi:hypothetical protein